MADGFGSWRFGIETHIVSASFRGQQRILPPVEKTQKPLAIFVEQINKAWDETTLENLRTLIGFAYNSNSLLWIEFCSKLSSGSSPSKNSTVASKLSLRVQKAKDKTPMELLGAKSAARLESMYALPVYFGDREI